VCRQQKIQRLHNEHNENSIKYHSHLHIVHKDINDWHPHFNNRNAHNNINNDNVYRHNYDQHHSIWNKHNRDTNVVHGNLH
jgi:hypothetical protein